MAQQTDVDTMYDLSEALEYLQGHLPNHSRERLLELLRATIDDSLALDGIVEDEKQAGRGEEESVRAGYHCVIEACVKEYAYHCVECGRQFCSHHWDTMDKHECNTMTLCSLCGENHTCENWSSDSEESDGAESD